MYLKSRRNRTTQQQSRLPTQHFKKTEYSWFVLLIDQAKNNSKKYIRIVEKLILYRFSLYGNGRLKRFVNCCYGIFQQLYFNLT
ncbi:hypothetical protein AR546_11480 [Leptospira interrogans serovar Canicola]|nr:hypothetical protein B2G50_09190 [Leptospira interrogans serovar Canicola]OLZ31246.1 hypothetical protein AR546_11480 [Leptospira interrogans serovar Canicola]OMH63226.1 hypothetical protein BW243_14345 [Leptospira interrogans serovar Pomona]OOB95557.1 hypothetical protein B0192_20105 [Leptospira interrogans serovar Australis]POR19049.1 hypothetical protein B0T34_07260 [Leptospira interrogans serovar Canicola]